MKLIGFLFKILWTLVTQPFVILVLAVLLFLMFRFGGNLSEQPAMSIRFAKNVISQSQAVDQATGQVAETIVRACPSPEKSYTRLLIMPLRDDRERALENQIREKFQKRIEQGEFTLVEKSAVTQIGEQVREFLPGGDAEPSPITKEEAIRIGKAANAEFVLFGEVETFMPEEKTHKIEGNFQFVNIATGDTIAASWFSNFVKAETSPEHISQTESVPILKLTILFLFILIWPFALVPLMRWVTRRESNRDNFLAIALMAAIPFGITVVFLGNMTPLSFYLTGLLLFFVMTAGWIGFVMNKVAE